MIERRRSRTWRRFLAGFLAAVVLSVSMPQSVYAWYLPIPGQNGADAEEPEIILTKLEELPAPTEEPAKGYLGMKVAREKTTAADGLVTYRWQETYLPVITDKNEIVYGKLDSLEELLGLHVYSTGSNKKVQVGKTSIYLTLGTMIAVYQTPFFAVQVVLGSAPLYFEDQWYVPLDSFLEITGSYRFFAGETTAETDQLVVIPPQETVLDSLADYAPFRESKYRFDFGKELGYTEDSKAIMKGSNLLIQLVNRLATLDPATWKASAMTYLGMEEEALQVVSKDYIETFTDSMLMMDEAQVERTYETAKTSMDAIGLVADTVMNAQEASLREMLEHSKNILLECPATRLSHLEVLEEGYAAANSMAARTKGVSAATNLIGYFCSYEALATKLKNGDTWMMEAGDAFLKDAEKLSDPAMDSFMRKTIQERIDAFDNQGKSGSNILLWLSKNYSDVILNGLDFLKGGYFGVITKATTIWKLGVGLLYGKYMDISQAELAAVYGELYQTDAMRVTDQVLKDTFSWARSSWTAQDEERIRMALCTEIKAAYVTRSFAISAEAENHLDYYPQVKERLKSICNELCQFLVEFSDLDRSFGLMPQDMTGLGDMGEKYYPNVVFNIAEITGQILVWASEKPAKNVKLEVHDVDGTLLAEGTTDSEGMFDIAFELGDIDSLDRDDGGFRKLNLYLYYKNDPVIMELLEIACFHKYQIDGLRAGERDLERLVYLKEAREENGKTVLLVQEIDLGEKPVVMDVPDLYGNTLYTAYFSFSNDMELSEWKSFVLRDGVSFGSVYTAMVTENGLIDGLLYATKNMNGIYPEEFTWREMKDADEINTFIEVYREMVKDDPVYILTTVNSEVKNVEPSIVNPN